MFPFYTIVFYSDHRTTGISDNMIPQLKWQTRGRWLGLRVDFAKITTYNVSRTSQSLRLMKDATPLKSAALSGSKVSNPCLQMNCDVSTRSGRITSAGRNNHCFQDLKNCKGTTAQGTRCKSWVFPNIALSKVCFNFAYDGAVSTCPYTCSLERKEEEKYGKRASSHLLVFRLFLDTPFILSSDVHGCFAYGTWFSLRGKRLPIREYLP